ncbi:uncharacterized protein TrAtP1_003391 [Trichoderma atroviride]|uniref:uncharacterized protein n=1 Tax=Hypocrea atroviridis TaxID=63577 RepID=UPI003320D88F|nr:hypothetical protein TrAtP1_003391 [Trichoderma atroviride]
MALAVRKCLWLHLTHEAFSGADAEVFKWPDAWQPRSQQMQHTCTCRHMRSGKAVDADRHWQMQKVSEHVATQTVSGLVQVCICMNLHPQTEFTRNVVKTFSNFLNSIHNPFAGARCSATGGLADSTYSK